MLKRIALLTLVLLTLNGCDQISQKLGLEDPGKKEARLETEGKAVGSACRHSGRAIEDCYAIYSWLPKAGIFEGWREMDVYMRENKIESIIPQLPPPEPPGTTKRKKKAPVETSSETSSPAKEEAAGKPEEKASTKH